MMKSFKVIKTVTLVLAFFSLCLILSSESKVKAQDGFLNPDIDYAVGEIVLQPDGKIIISGGFSNVGGQPRGKVARLNADGTLDTTFQDPKITGDLGNDGVFALARQPDGKILIGGLFKSVGGQERNRLARLNADGSLDTSFTSDVNSSITAIALQADGKILIGGYFTSVSGQTRNSLARLNPDGSIDASLQNPDIKVPHPLSGYPVGTIAVQPDGKILVSGYFNSVGGQARSSAVRLNADGTLDASFNLNLNNGIVSQFVFQPDGKILIGGFFRTVNGTEQTSAARINADGTLDPSFQNPNIPSGNITTLDIQADGKVVVGGDFSIIAGQEREDLARLNADGTFDSSFQDPNTNFGGTFYTISAVVIQPDGKILVGGSFYTVGRQPRKMLVRLNPDGTLDLPPAQVFTVTKTADTNDGTCNEDCSLREAIVAANANVESSQINFDAGLFNTPQTITLTSGELVIADNRRVNINGTGENLITVSGNNQSRVFRINRDAVVTVTGLTISDGNGAGDWDSGNGGGVHVSLNGTNTVLTLNNVTVSNNQGLAGGGVYVMGATLNVTNSRFTGNTVTYNQGGGGIYFYGGTLNVSNTTFSGNASTFFNGGCGGIEVGNSFPFSLANLIVTGNKGTSTGGVCVGGAGTISDSVISNNQGDKFGGGLAVVGTVTMTNTTISGNNVVSDSGNGGGIVNYGKLIALNSEIKNNTAGYGGGIFTSGGLTLTGVTVSGNTAKTGSGGGIYNNSGENASLPVLLNDSTISGNKADFGGGIYNRAIVTTNNSKISDNSVSLGGGGVFNVSLNGMAATFTLTNSVVNGNYSNSGGGGMQNQAGTINLTSSTVSKNQAKGIGGAIAVTQNGSVNLNYATLAFNTAFRGGGVSNGSEGTVKARNTIIGRNIVSNTSPDFSGTLSSQGYNLIGDSAGATITGDTTGNLLNVDPMLDPILRYNGAPTQTHALRQNSPAIDAGGSDPAVSTDQRGQARLFDFPLISNAQGGNGSDIGAFERKSSDITSSAAFDFDGDGKTDNSIYRASAGEWWYLRSSDAGNRAFQFGNSTDRIVPADYTGDGKTDVAFFRPSTGEWFVLRSEDGSFYSAPFGAAGDIPAPADYDGDGKADLAVFRPSEANWYINRSSGGFTILQFGATGDVPIPADYDGDGKADLAIYRPSKGEWWILRSSDGGNRTFQFGNSTDKPIPGDYTGDGKTDIAFYRPSTSEWFVLRSEDGSFYSAPFGAEGDVPVAGDYDGDGKADIAVWRPSDRNWYVAKSTGGFSIAAFGSAGDKPVPNAFVP